MRSYPNSQQKKGQVCEKFFERKNVLKRRYKKDIKRKDMRELGEDMKLEMCNKIFEREKI